MNVARLVARLLIGGLFIGHGMQKLRGWFGGPGLDGTAKMMESLDLCPPRRHAVLAGATETGGGALLVAGLASPLAEASLIGVMITAIRKVHLPNGPWNTDQGWEYNAVLIAALAMLAETGPGLLSLDAARGRARGGTLWALAALASGALASTLTINAGSTAAEDEPGVAPDADRR